MNSIKNILKTNSRNPSQLFTEIHYVVRFVRL
jgi:hypothetical protein